MRFLTASITRKYYLNLRKKFTSDVELANNICVSTRTVRRLNKKFDLQSINKENIESRNKEIIELYKSGKTIKEVSRHYGLSESYIRKIITTATR